MVDTDPNREPHDPTAEPEPTETEPDKAEPDKAAQEAVATVLADGPLTVGGLYRLASPADRARIDEALADLLHTLDRMPSTVDEPWLTEARYEAEDTQQTLREIQQSEEKQNHPSTHPHPQEAPQDPQPRITINAW
jgi:hypothetical protein